MGHRSLSISFLCPPNAGDDARDASADTYHLEEYVRSEYKKRGIESKTYLEWAVLVDRKDCLLRVRGSRVVERHVGGVCCAYIEKKLKHVSTWFVFSTG